MECAGGVFAFERGLKAGPSTRTARGSRTEWLGFPSSQIREGLKAPCIPGQGCRGVFHPGCSGLEQTWVLFSPSSVCSFFDWLLSALSQAPCRPDRRDENELSSSAEEIRERDREKVREIKQK